MLFCVASCVSCLRFCEVDDDDAGGGVKAAHDADVADNHSAADDDAVDDVVDDDKEAEVTSASLRSTATSVTASSRPAGHQLRQNQQHQRDRQPLAECGVASASQEARSTAQKQLRTPEPSKK